MEHRTAVDHQFVERYLLDELSPDEATEFEAHFFDCPWCAEEVRKGIELRANLRATLRDDAD